MLVWLLIGSFLPVSASLAGEERTLHADLRHRPPEMIVDGAFLSGPLKDLLDEAAARSGWQVEWHAIPFPESLERLKKGTVDVVPRVIRTPDREPYVQFLGPVSSQRKDILFMVPKGREASVTDYEDLVGKRIGIKKDTAYFARFDGDASLRKVLSDGSDYALARDLIEGRVDTLAVLDQGALESAMTGFGFSGFGYAFFRHSQVLDNYYGFSKFSRNAELANGLSATLQSMATSGRVAEIYAKHQLKVETLSQESILLTEGEKNWLANHPGPLKVSIPAPWPPIAYPDEQGRLQGIAIDTLKTIGERLGIVFEVVADSGKSPGADLTLLIDRQSKIPTGLHVTDPLLAIPQVIITRQDAPFLGRLEGLHHRQTRVVNGSRAHAELLKEHPAIRLEITETLPEGLRQVSNEEAHAFVGDLFESMHEIQKGDLNNLKVAAHTQLTKEVRFGVAADRPELAAILNKALAAMSDRERNAIQNAWLNIRIEIGTDLSTILAWARPAVGGIVLLFLTFIFWNRRLKREVRQRREIEASLNAALAGGELGVWDLDPRTRIMRVNSRGEKMLGFPPAGVISRDEWIANIHPDDRPRVREMDRAILNGETTRYEVEFRAMTQDGGERLLLARGAVMDKDDRWGTPTRVVGTIQDITQRRAMEDALTESEARSRLLLTSVTDGIIGMDRSGRITFVNPAALAMLGFTEEELANAPLHETIHHTRIDGTAYPAGECRLARSYREGETCHVDGEMFWRKDGSGFFVEYTAVPMWREAVLIGGVTVFRDISARMREQKRLLTLSNAVENSPVSVIITNPAGIIEYVNPQFTRVSGFSAQEAIGRSPNILNASIQDRAYYRHLWSTIHSGQVWRGEIFNRKKNGELFVEQASISPIRDENDRITHFVAVKEDITERKQAEEKLALANYLSENALDLTKAGHWHLPLPLDELGHYNASERTARIYGDPPREGWRYRWVEEWFANVQAGNRMAAETTWSNFQDALAGRVPRFDAVYAYKRPSDGRVAWLHTIGHLVRGPSGDPTDMYGVTQDITDTMLTTLEIERQRATMRALINAIPDPIWYKNPEGVYLDCNEAFAARVGKPVDRIIERTDHELLEPEIADRFRAREQATLADLKPQTDEEWVVYPDGRRVLLEEVRTPFWNEHGQLLGILGISRDITERKQVEEKLRENLALRDRMADVERFNRLALGREQRIIELKYLVNAMAKERGREPMFQSPEQDDLPESAEPSTDELFQQRLAALSLAEDAERSRVELEAYKEHLEELVDERTRELTVAMGKAQAAAKAKSDFLANMSHEIRTPMNAIIGMTHLVLRTELNDKQRNHIQKVEGAAKNLLGIINDILDFSKIEAGKMNVEQADFSLKVVLDHVNDISLLKARDKGLDLVFRIPSTVPDALIGDGMRLGQVLTNLVNNAIKFTEKGRVLVAASRIADEDDHVRLRFAITDTGIGLSREQIGRLFEAFSQGDGSTSRRYGGTGLGLSISKRLVELMDGEIGVESEPGVGSTFHFTARFGLRHVTCRAEPANFQPDGEIPEAARSALMGRHLLLVEDHPVNRELALELLQLAGIRVEVAVNGAEALTRLDQGSFDGVLMDCQMPVMDGYEATRRIRANPRFADLPILAMTANAMVEDREKCLACGMNDHIAKPLDVSQLFVTLARWIRSERQDMPPSPVEPPSLAPTPPPAAPTVPHLPGVDTAQALKRMGGSHNLLRKMIVRFRETQASFVTRLDAALKDRELIIAIRETHTLKGLAANIGATDLVERSREVEEILKKGGELEGVVEARAALDTELTRIVRAIDAAMEENGPPPSPPSPPLASASVTVDREELATGMSELAVLLGEYDSTASGKVLGISEKLGAMGMHREADRLKRLIDQYEFEDALDKLREIAQNCQIKL
ncbi:Sensor histidine kinase RcsC [Candidatus Magnetaquicoccaceae bacterium FCR-1]|uniref:histidine kinase n=1 Tax=Candidatus Magnetaquiglobus chichijimensis TaxID=3141448 RepID=A0ABQ0C8F1_9PROT